MTEAFRYYPSKEQFLKLSRKSNLIPVYREIAADLKTPVSVYAKVFREGYSCLLESIEGKHQSVKVFIYRL